MMKHYLNLVPVSARVHKKQSRMTRICIILAVFLVTVIFGMADMEIRSQKIQQIDENGNWHAAFQSITEEQAGLIASRPEVEEASWGAVTNGSLDLDYTIQGTKTAIVGIGENFPKIFSEAEIMEGDFPKAAGEAMFPQGAKNQLDLRIGDTVQLHTPEQEIVNLKVCGFCKNSSKLMKADVFGIYMDINAYKGIFDKASDKISGNYYVKFSTHCRINHAISDIKKQLSLTDDQVQENTVLIGLEGQSTNSYMRNLYMVAIVLAVLVAASGILMITSSLNSNVAQRIQFFGMLRCLGATRKQIIRFVRIEALNWCKTAIPIGLAGGTIVIWGLCKLLKILSPRYFTGMPDFGISWPGILGGAVIGLATVLLASGTPAKRAAKVSALTAVSGNAGAEQKVSKAANTRFYKVETALGINHAKNSKRNFVLMSGSFAFSIILFLAFTTAIDFMHHAITPLRPYTPDLSIVSEENTQSISENLQTRIGEQDAVKRVYGRMFAYNVPVSLNGTDMKINLISYEKNQFQWAKDRMVQGSLGNVENGSGVVIVYDSGNPLKLGTEFAVNQGNGEQKLKVSGVLSDSPFDREDGVETVICSEETFHQLTGQSGYTIIDVQLKKNADDKDVENIRRMAGENVIFSDQRLDNSQAKGAYYSFALFLYGFLVIIALIAIFNIVNSIAMSVSARLQQYGAMRAVGMSTRQVFKMVAAEAVTYVMGGIVAGCAIGLPINRILYRSMVTSHWGTEWSLPLIELEIILCVVAVATFIAVCAPARRIQNLSVTDTIAAQ